MKSPTVLTLQWLRDNGYIADKVEHWNPFSKTRKDLFGIIDIIAAGKGKVLGVQATTRANVSARVKKAMENEYLPAWLTSARFEVWGWYHIARGLDDARIVKFSLNDNGTLSTS